MDVGPGNFRLTHQIFQFPPFNRFCSSKQNLIAGGQFGRSHRKE
jgi:hypothetical protein